MYSITDRLYIWLDSFSLTYNKKLEMISISGGIDNLFVALKTSEYKDKIKKIVSEQTYERMVLCANEAYIDKLIETLDNLNIYCLIIENSYYSKLLSNIADPPFVLYTKGDVKLLNKNCLAVVGTRKPTRYGREVAEDFSKKLANSGLVLCSGLAFGIDTCVAQACVDLKLPTIAVLAGGLDSIYPAANFNLSEQILNFGGLLVSEYPPHVKPTQYSFLERNRIISGISLGVLVVEAGERSGATATANDAIEQGRELFVIPGNITSYASVGCNNLINAMPDCFCIRADQILKTLKIDTNNDTKNTSKEKTASSIQFGFEENLILDAMGQEELSVDELQEITQIDAKTLLSKLTTLEIGGIIKKVAGNYYVKINLPK